MSSTFSTVIIIIVAFITGYYLFSKIIDKLFKTGNTPTEPQDMKSLDEEENPAYLIYKNTILLIGLVCKDYDFLNILRRSLLEKFIQNELSYKPANYTETIRLIERGPGEAKDIDSLIDQILSLNTDSRDFLEKLLILIINLITVEQAPSLEQETLINRIGAVFNIQETVYSSYMRKES